MLIMEWILETGKGRVDLGNTGRQGTELFSKESWKALTSAKYTEYAWKTINRPRSVSNSLRKMLKGPPRKNPDIVVFNSLYSIKMKAPSIEAFGEVT